MTYTCKLGQCTQHKKDNVPAPMEITNFHSTFVAGSQGGMGEKGGIQHAYYCGLSTVASSCFPEATQSRAETMAAFFTTIIPST